MDDNTEQQAWAHQQELEQQEQELNKEKKMNDKNKAIEGFVATCLALTGKVKKDGINPHFQNKYASLESVLETVLPACHDNKIVPLQEIISSDNGIEVRTTIYHESGDCMSLAGMPVPVDKNTAQGVVSASTYGRRVSLMAIFGLAPSDDDGNAAESAPPITVTVNQVEFERHKKLIEDAPGGQALKIAFEKSIKFAKDTNNADYKKEFVRIKDECKDRLLTNSEAA